MNTTKQKQTHREEISGYQIEDEPGVGKIEEGDLDVQTSRPKIDKL